MKHERHTDVLHVDLCFPTADSVVEVIDVGEALGFPGQVIARVDREHQILYGLTVENYAAFRRRLMWKYRMGSVQMALELLVRTLRIALGMERHNPVLC